MDRKVYDVDLCVIGAGSGGLSVASGAAQLGRSVVLFEAGKMGGDCLNYGCVPSKALIAAADMAHTRREGKAFGVKPVAPEVDFKGVMKHVRSVIAGIEPHDSQERFEGLGCIVIREAASFLDAKTVISKSAEVRAKRIVIATGSRASAPPIPGLSDVKYLTNETIFDLKTLPEHLVIIGGGPIGLELGQSFRRLGSQVSLIDIAPPLERYDAAQASELIDSLKAEGVKFYAPAKTDKITSAKSGVTAKLADGKQIKGSHLLVAAGRKPNIEKLNLEAAGVNFDRGGVITDDNLRSSNPRVFALGDAASGRGGLTHIAGYQAGVLIRQFYFLPPLINRVFAKASNAAIPAAIYTAPELATIGKFESDLKASATPYKKLIWPFMENDRAAAEEDRRGNVTLLVTPRGKLLGASILGRGAGDMIQIIALAMSAGVKLSQLSQFISPYPTRSEAVKRAASSYYTEMVFSPKAKKWAGLLTKLQG